MAHFEYKVIPAPRRGEKIRGVRAAEDRFAIALTSVMNAQAAEGWEYQRTETLPSEEREGLMGKATVFQNMMVFRRIKASATDPATAAPVPLIEDKRNAPADAAPQVAEAPPAGPPSRDPLREPPVTAPDAPKAAAADADRT